MFDWDWLIESVLVCPTPVFLRKDEFLGRPVLGMLEVKEFECVSEGD